MFLPSSPRPASQVTSLVVLARRVSTRLFSLSLSLSLLLYLSDAFTDGFRLVSAYAAPTRTGELESDADRCPEDG
jgi:hypothetical protein